MYIPEKRRGLTAEGFQSVFHRHQENSEEERREVRGGLLRVLGGTAMVMVDASANLGSQLDGATGVVGACLVAFGVFKTVKHARNAMELWNATMLEEREKELLERLPKHDTPFEKIYNTDGSFFDYGHTLEFEPSNDIEYAASYDFMECVDRVRCYPAGPVIGFGHLIFSMAQELQRAQDPFIREHINYFYRLLDKHFPSEGLSWQDYIEAIRDIPEIVEPLGKLTSLDPRA